MTANPAAGPPELRPVRADLVRIAGRGLAVVGLLVDAAVHLRLAPLYDPVGSAVTQGQLFRLEAALAAVAAVLLLASGHRRAWTFGGLVALAGLAAVLVTRYVEVPALGPVPGMYDPQWTPDKVVVTGAMAVVVVAWLTSRVQSAVAGRPVSRSAG